jgi:hypothetical protein
MFGISIKHHGEIFRLFAGICSSLMMTEQLKLAHQVKIGKHHLVRLFLTATTLQSIMMRLKTSGHVDISNIDYHFRPTNNSDPLQNDICI